MEIALLIILYISSSAFAIQVVESELSFKIKRLLYLHIPNRRLVAFSNIILKKHSLLYLPMLILIKYYSKFHLFIQELLSCPVCTSFWIGIIINYFVVGMTLVYSALFAPAIVAITIVLMYFMHDRG